MKKNWLDTIARVAERLVPDAITTSILLLVFLAVLAVSIGASVQETVDAYYRGLWMLLAFTMQMSLILALSLILAATPAFKKLIIAVSRIPRTTAQVVAAASLFVGLISYVNWGLSLATGPLIAIHFCREAERKGIRVDFMFMLAILAGAGSIWQFGLSASAPLLMATPGHFLEKTTGLMPLSSTIWSPASIVHVIAFAIAVIVAGCLFMPKKTRPVSEFPEAYKLGDPDTPGGDSASKESDSSRIEIDTPKVSFAQRLERSPIVIVPLCAGARRLALLSLLRQESESRHKLAQHYFPAALFCISQKRSQLYECSQGGRRFNLAGDTHVSPLCRRCRPDPVHSGR